MVTAATLLRKIKTLEHGPEVQEVKLQIAKLKNDNNYHKKPKTHEKS